MIDRKKVLWGITDDNNKLFLSKMCDIAERSINSYKVMFSKFLNPEQRLLIENRLSNEVSVSFFGGFFNSDRTMAAFGEIDANCEFPIKAIKIQTKNKLTYSHRDYLGSLLALGITRELLGDIVIKDNYAILFCVLDISEFIITNLQRVSSATVKLSYLDDLADIEIEKHFKETNITVSSMRFDCVLSAITGKSRSESVSVIEQGLASVNYNIVKNVSAHIKNGDILSLRGYGKMIVETDNSVTRKGRIHILIKKYI